MKYPIALVCSLCMLLLCAACDSQDSRMAQEQEPQCVGEVKLLYALQDTSTHAGDIPLTLLLGGEHLAFEQTAGHPITYTANSDDAFVDVEVVDNLVQVSASQTGDAQVHVAAFDACDQRAEATFTVHFRDSCPPSAPPGEVSFMPVHVGDSWTYAYTNYSRTEAGWSDVVADTGQVHLTAIAETCLGGQRLVTLKQQVEVERTSWTEGRSNDSTRVTQIAEEDEVQLIEYEDGRVLHPFATEPFMRFNPSTNDSVQVDGGEVRLLKHTCGGFGTMSLTLRQDEGVVAARFRQCMGSAAVMDRGRLELVSSQSARTNKNGNR